MKKQIILNAIILCCAFFNVSGQNVKSTKAQVSKATVYLAGAQLTCQSVFQAAPGINQFVFEGISPQLDLNSIQAGAQGSIVIMDVKYETRYNQLAAKPVSKNYELALKQANDSLVMTNFDLEDINNHIEGLNTEKNILLNNRLIKGDTRKDTLDLFKESIEFLRTRLNNINAESLRYKKLLHVKTEQQQQLINRIHTLNQVSQAGEKPTDEATHTIVVTALADVATAATVHVSFYVNNAAWLPVYDLRASQNGTIDLNYKAEVRQQTGMDWNNTKLTLSTGNPNLGTQRPNLNPFYLNFINAYKKRFREEPDNRPAQKNTAAGSTDMAMAEDALDAYTAADFTSVNEGMVQTEFDINLKYSIPHGDASHVVAIQNKTVKANYKYSVVPKLDVNAYLMAEITDWSDMTIIPGAARLYFDGSYVGKTMLNTAGAEDTLRLGFGRDRSIIVQRKKLNDKTREKLILDEKLVTTSYEISVRNQKATTIKIELLDQIPLTNNQLIKVEAVETGDADYNTETGLLTWNLNIKPKESRKVKFSYDIKIPKDKRVAGL